MRFPPPKLQIGFAVKLKSLRGSILQQALLRTVADCDIVELDRELEAVAPRKGLSRLASLGLRGELLFATPALLTARPSLLGYYRLLLGYSQKDFYSGKRGFSGGPFKAMELSGKLAKRQEGRLPELCEALCVAAGELLDVLDGLDLSASFLADLTLLTLGAQLRGSANNSIGKAGVEDMAALIGELTATTDATAAGKLVTLKNAAGRTVLIEFGADPDITIKQSMGGDQFESLLAVEIKAGTDSSNLYNRLGEAEKSHNTARANGFTECWTIINVRNVDMAVARQKTPTTDRFYQLGDLLSKSGVEYDDFRARFSARLGLMIG